MLRCMSDRNRRSLTPLSRISLIAVGKLRSFRDHRLGDFRIHLKLLNIIEVGNPDGRQDGQNGTSASISTSQSVLG